MSSSMTGTPAGPRNGAGLSSVQDISASSRVGRADALLLTAVALAAAGALVA
jgi:hypothetical protein